MYLSDLVPLVVASAAWSLRQSSVALKHGPMFLLLDKFEI